MKKFTTLLSILLTVSLKAQSFGTDVIVDNFGNRRKMESAIAPNGWMYEASYAVDGAGAYHQFTIRRSIDGGLTWSTLINTDDSNYSVIDFDFVATGTTSTSVVLHFTRARLNLTTGENDVYLDRIDGATGVNLGLDYFYNAGSNGIRSTAIAVENILASSTSSPPRIAVIFAVSEPSSDVIYYLQSTNGGLIFEAPYIIETTAQFVGETTIDYGHGTALADGRFNVAYESLTDPSNPTGNIVFLQQGGGGGFFPGVNLTASGSLTGACRNPRIAMQQSTTNNSNGEYTMAVVAEHDPTGINADSDIIGFINTTPMSTNSWFRVDAIVGGTYCYSHDVIYQSSSERFVTSYFDYTTGSITASTLSRNAIPGNSWTSLATNINDLGLNTVFPQIRLLSIPVANQIGICWIEESPVLHGNVHFDRQGNSASLETTEQLKATVYPNPVQNELFIETDGVSLESAFIRDLNGRIIKELSQNELHTKQVNMVSIASGIYVLQLETSQGKSAQRFIKY